MLHICPESHSEGEILPHVLIFPDILLAELYKRSDTVILYLILAVDPDLLFDLYLYRKPVGIPACLTRYHLALHGLISRNKVLDAPCEHVAYVRLTVCRRRPVIKYIARIALMFFDGFFKNIVVLPEFLDLFFSFHEIHGGVNLSV